MANQPNLQFPLVGMVQRVEKGGTEEKPVFRHLIIAKPEDEYGSRNTLLVSSSRMIGAEGQEVETTIQLNGYVDRFNYIDRQSGERRNGENQKAWFHEVIE